MGLQQLLQHVMASQVEYVNCQELHNPSFTPPVFSSQRNASSDAENQPLEETSVPPDIELVASSVNSMPVEEALEDHVSRLEIAQEGPSDPFSDGYSQQIGATSVFYVGSVTAPVLSPPKAEVLPSPMSASEPPLHEQTVVSQSGAEGSDSVPVDEAVRNIAAVNHESTSKPKNPSPSDSDDVQFILSVARRKRRKRPKQDHPPGDQAQGGNAHEQSNIPGETNKHKNSSSNTDQQTVGVSSSMFTSPRETSHAQISTQHAQDGSPSLSVTPASALVRSPSSNTLTPKARKPTSRKRKRDQDTVSNNTTSLVGNANTNSTFLSPQTPIQHRYLPYAQMIFPARPLSHIQHMPGINPASTSQPMPEFEAYSLPLGLGPQFQQSGASGGQHAMCSLVGPAASANLTSASMSASLRHRPSLYAVPQWQSSPPSTGIVQQAMPASPTSSVYQSSCVSRDGNLQGASPGLSHIAGPGNLRSFGGTPIGPIPPQTATSQPQTVQVPTARLREPAKSTHPPNMLVDIAQTCQDNFPFALVAKRHNQPIQKVFDTFSAVIQLPLLRSAVDARRPGKLGSARMKEFRAMKKSAKELQKMEGLGRKGGKKVEKEIFGCG
jgi:hypothetical protein